jgi:hypothetical protein
MSGTPARPHFLPLHAAWRLNQAVAPIHAAFDGYGCYLVGSSLLTKDYRDVDVRLIMPDKPFDRLFASKRGRHLWTLTCVTLSEHLTSVTGLPVDFQPQQATEANGGDYPGSRHPLGKGLSAHYSAAVPGGIDGR